MNKKTTALTTEQYKKTIQTTKKGFCGGCPNERIATASILEDNLGLYIQDISKQDNQEKGTACVCMGSIEARAIRVYLSKSFTEGFIGLSVGYVLASFCIY